MKQINLSLQHEQAIVLQGNYGGSAADFSALARLMHTDLLEQPKALPNVVCEDTEWKVPENLSMMFSSGTVDAFYDSNLQQCRLYVKTPERLHRLKLGVFVWQMSVVGGAMSAIMRGSKAHLMHCAMLEKNGRALLLCGESGIGKSTSVRRYLAAGGQALSDDMVLLEHAPDGRLLAYRLPTWSACREGLEDWVYPFAPPLEVTGILALGRASERETITDIPEAEFFAQLYRCSFFHYLWSCGNLPEESKLLLAAVLRESVQKMVGKFAPRALMAHLDGDLLSTLRGIL